MTEILQAESILTDRYQTTIPDLVCKTLGLSKRDKIAYEINPDGTVTITRSEAVEEDPIDPILDKFRDFLAEDMLQNPQYLQPITLENKDTVQFLASDIDDIDLDISLSDEEE